MANILKYFTIPNILTFLRIPMTALLIIFVVSAQRANALIIWILIIITELDGTIARLNKQTTKFGYYFDYAVDFIFGGGAVIVLLAKGWIPLYFVWVCLVIVAAMFFIFAIKAAFRKKLVWKKSRYEQYMIAPIGLLVITSIVGFKYNWIIVVANIAIVFIWALEKTIANFRKC